MDRNTLLATTRTEFLNAFAQVFNPLVQGGAAQLFGLAERARTLHEQQQLLDARAVLLEHVPALIEAASQHLERLVNRGFQTAYNTYRPSFSLALGQSPLLLVDSDELEGELRINEIAQHLRYEAEDALRDLNIRIAILFGQEDISERENPFRPYLFPRCVVLALQEIKAERAVVDTLLLHFCNGLTPYIPEIYARLNALLAEQGIAAQLQLKIKRQEAIPRLSAEQKLGQLSENGLDSYAVEMAALAAQGDGGVLVPAKEGESRSEAPPQQSYSPANYELPQAQVKVESLINRVLGKSIPQPSAPMGSGAFPAPLPQSSPMPQGQPFMSAADLSALSAQMGGGLLPGAMSLAPEHGAEMTKGVSGWLFGAAAVGQTMRRLFSGQWASERATTRSESTFAESPLAGAVDGLQRSTPSSEALQGDDGQLRNLIMELRSGLTGMAHDEDEQMTIDIVGMLFEFILRDPQVPAEVRAQLARLQFLVLKIALRDPDLFAQKNHPARLLVNRVGMVATGLQQSGLDNSRVVAEIQRVIETLLQDSGEDLSLFSRMLDEFDGFITQELRVADDKVNRAAVAMERAESRTLEFARISAMIAAALDGLRLDDLLHHFLLDHWAQAIERASRVDDDRARRYTQFMPDLIWSIAPKIEKADRQLLFGMIPELLATLREGLELTELSWDEQQSLTSWLIESHTLALRATSSPLPVPPLEMLRERFGLYVDSVQANWEPSVTRIDADMLAQAIRETEADLNLIDKILADEVVLGAEDALAEVSAEMVAEIESGEVMERLRSGVAVEMHISAAPSLARLSWVSSHAANLVLSIEGDEKPAVISVRLFKRLLAQGRARFVEEAPLFERAVGALLESADAIDQG